MQAVSYERPVAPPSGGGGVLFFRHETHASDDSLMACCMVDIVLHACVFVRAVLSLHVAHSAGSIRVIPLVVDIFGAQRKACVVMSDTRCRLRSTRPHSCSYHLYRREGDGDCCVPEDGCFDIPVRILCLSVVGSSGGLQKRM